MENMMKSSNGSIFRVTGPVNSPHKGQWRGALMFSLICVWINGWVNKREAGDLKRYRGHYDVMVMNHWWHDPLDAMLIKCRHDMDVTLETLAQGINAIAFHEIIRGKSLWHMPPVCFSVSGTWIRVMHSQSLIRPWLLILEHRIYTKFDACHWINCDTVKLWRQWLLQQGPINNKWACQRSVKVKD